MSTEMIPAASGHSAEVDKIVAALSKAQGELSAPKKGRKATIKARSGGEFTYSYADLGDVIETYKAVLAKHELSLFHTTEPTGDGGVVLMTWLCHSSGQFFKGAMTIPSCDDARNLGSWLTYYRRYSACGMLGIAAEEDDDGEGAHRKAGSNGSNGHKPEPKAESKPKSEPITDFTKSLPPPDVEVVMAAAKARWSGTKEKYNSKEVSTHLNRIAERVDPLTVEGMLAAIKAAGDPERA